MEVLLQSEFGMNPTIDKQRECFRAGGTLPVAERRERLEQLYQAIEEHQDAVLEALKADLGKSPQEAYASEIAFVLGDIRHTLKRITSWTRPRRVPTPLSLWPARSVVRAEPFGVSLIIGPWNYPFQLLLSPLVSAVAAGNTVVLKPSEHAPRTAEVVGQVVRAAFPESWVTVVTGDHEVAKDLLRERFDHIFFTGGTRIGREVMKAAAEHLTPVTLELGGKCPCIVAADANLEVAAKRIVWGKFMNAGQTCVAPDHVWVDQRVAGRLLEQIQQVLVDFYGDDPSCSADYGRIVNERHFDRLAACLGDGVVLTGGQSSRDDLFIAPTVMTDIRPGSALMGEEIFGPILPVLIYDDLDKVLAELSEGPAPLALYLFSESRALQDEVVGRTKSGGVCINDTISHLLNRDLPFGGVGESGMGACHGKAGFDAFSHRRAVMTRGSRVDPDFRYPPMRFPVAQLKRVLRWFG